MRYRSLGTSGLIVSSLGLGCNNLGGRIDNDTSARLVSACLDRGVTLFDVADVYGRRDSHAGASEEALGLALAGRRNEAIIATKFGMNMQADADERGISSGASRTYILRAVEASLRRLKTDWIDLYQLHCPDPRTPLDETLQTLDQLIRAGKIRYAGVSNLPPWQVADACHIARRDNLAGIISCQDELSLLACGARSELVPAMRHFGLGLLPYFPLASGMLTGKYRQDAPPPEGSRLSAWTYLQARYRDPAVWARVEALQTVADRNDLTLTGLAFGWLLGQDIVGSVIAGATSIDQLDANVSACASPLPDCVISEIEAVLSGTRDF
ncbi:aldo/keto reductase [Asaia krungthepensis]|uniref:Oxidoreductase n=1 Tax=Asaia krungthepensis NRIC 0535 TaxID=1307925 RepID=A0ABQ0PXN8_9PROT|nr:aldo/keto reductase [Asaia krungthepensis]GBQ84111.1 putative oxidoreductase [Asaia krungthepensis NRIC 0535]